MMSAGLKKFRDVIQDHKIFQELDLGAGENLNAAKPDQLIHIHDDSIYVWDGKFSCLNSISLGLIMEDKIADIQKLKCSPPPTYTVQKIIFNASGTMVALIGQNRASVLVLPERWRQSNESGQTYCKCLPIGERFFRTSVAVNILETAWHPGSSGDNHICLLLSDNTLRIFQTSADLQNPIQVHKLGQQIGGSSRFSLTSSKPIRLVTFQPVGGRPTKPASHAWVVTEAFAEIISHQQRFSISTGIGETVVSFAFARPVTVQERNKTILRLKNKDEVPAQLYPIYLLQGNGDVLLLLTSVTDSRYRRGILQGPLIMRPPAEDNYGVDSCSILVLDCTPTVLAIGTSSGRVHHCIALAGDDDYDSEDEAGDAQSTRSWPASVLSVKNKGAPAEFTAPTLYIFETVEMDSEINQDGEEEKDFIDLAVNLSRDPLLYCRYHCCTKYGIQAVVLPWMDKIVSYFEADDDDKDVMDDLSHARPCAVEHIICTKPSSANSESAIKGVTFATNALFGPSMLCLTADNRCTVLALLTLLKPVPRPATPSALEDDQPLQKLDEYSLNSWDFEEYIRSILQRDYTQPLLRYDASMGQTLVNKEACRLISRVTQIIRKEYILKQKLANDAILKRAEFLKEQDGKQQTDLMDLQERRQGLMNKAGELAENYEDCRDRLELLSTRLESIMKHAQSKAPVLSKAEVKMDKDLKMMNEKMKHLSNQVRQVHEKYNYQMKGAGVTESTSARSPAKASNPTLVQNFKDILSEEGKKIEDLVKKLNQMKVNVDK